jgi:transcriptional regulator with PAS, ATPase and Fis domain
MNLQSSLGGATSTEQHKSATQALTLREIEQNAILSALEAAGGNRGKAAQALGIDRSTLWRKLAAMPSREHPDKDGEE